MRRTVLLTALTTLIAGAAAGTAGATFPGTNGPILFRNVDFETGWGAPLLRALPDGTQMTRISRRPGGFSDWRADGRRIVFEFVQRDGDVQIATARPDERGLRVITSGQGIHEIPSWSPSGRRIVFGYSPEADPSTPGFETRLWTMRADGSRARALRMRRPGFDVEPKYSPNGRWIAFARLRPPRKKRELQTAIMIVRAKGGRVRRLTPWRDYPEQPPLATGTPSTPPGRPTAAGSSSTWRPTGRSRRCAQMAVTGTPS
jgi:Tol biopolymer transport system component